MDSGVVVQMYAPARPNVAIAACNRMNSQIQLGVGIHAIFKNQCSVNFYRNFLIRIHAVDDQNNRLCRTAERYTIFDT
ncbi:hypothetical protein D3C85_1670060 [compost metagenome]